MGLWTTIKRLFKGKPSRPQPSEPAQEEKVIKPPKDTHCNVCGEELTLMSYHCRYCSHGHCPRHRLPEDHRCTGKPVSPPKTGKVPVGKYNG